ncbi:MAG: hypothetical protein WDW36_007360 [Sanguina aurantia]
MTALHVALGTTSDPFWHPYKERMYEIVAELLAAGANPNIAVPLSSGLVATPNLNPLAWAAYDGRAALIRLMVEGPLNSTHHTPADVSATDGKGRTALHWAATCDFRLSSDEGAAATAAYLISRGADPWAKDGEGNTAFDRTPGKQHNCTAVNSDASDCPKVGSACGIVR